MSHYWCERCEVHGQGKACWSCGSTRVVRSGPKVDTIVYGDLG